MRIHVRYNTKKKPDTIYGERKPCPQCKCRYSHIRGDHIRNVWLVTCDNCRHIGLKSKTPEEAIEGWNTLRNSKYRY